MKLNQIVSRRGYEKFQYWDIVNEWEDILSKELQVPIVNEPAFLGHQIVRGLPFLYKLFTGRNNSLYFQLAAEIAPTRLKKIQFLLGLRNKNISTVIPCIIDFWVSKKDMHILNKIYSRNKVVLISSKEAFDLLTENQTPLPIVHWPLSLPDKYRFSESCLNEKKYDLALMGRQNPLLESFLKTYIKSHPDFICAHKRFEDGHFKYYLTDGTYIGNADSREEYMNIIKGAKIALYATPGLDGKADANGYNQVTPRFLELVANGCHIIARYSKNPDTDFYELDKFSKSIETYEDFEKAIDKARSTSIDIEFYKKYMSKHYTSVRAEQLKEILKEL